MAERDEEFERHLREAAEKYADDPSDIDRLVAHARERLAWRLRRGHKVCSKCHEPKPVSAFGQDSRERDGLHRVCRECRAKGYGCGRRGTRSDGPLS